MPAESPVVDPGRPAAPAPRAHRGWRVLHAAVSLALLAAVVLLGVHLGLDGPARSPVPGGTAPHAHAEPAP